MENGRPPLINARVLRAGSRCHRNRSTGLIAAGLLRHGIACTRFNLYTPGQKSTFLFFFQELFEEEIFPEGLIDNCKAII